MTTVVLLPGLHGTATLFEPLARALAPHFDVHTVEYPSDPRLGYAELERRVFDALTRNVRHDTPLVVLGESFSGPIAIRVALAERSRLVCLVLVATFANCPRPWLVRLAPLLITEPSIAVAKRLLLGPHGDAHLRAGLGTSLAFVGSELLRARLAAVRTIDVRDELARIEAPILDVRGSRDIVVPRSAGAVIRHCATHTRSIVLDAPHLVAQTRPDELACAIVATCSPE
jgi:pimeloyl-[acyl-carrier protein] methyl ester esterase